MYVFIRFMKDYILQRDKGMRKEVTISLSIEDIKTGNVSGCRFYERIEWIVRESNEMTGRFSIEHFGEGIQR